MTRFVPRGMGWIPDLPDPRDYSFRHEAIWPLLMQLSRTQDHLPDAVDLRSDDEGEYFAEAEDQGALNSSAAFAVLSVVEYFHRRMLGLTFNGSRLFLYKVTCNLIGQPLGKPGDSGANLRSTLKVLNSVGIPAEEYWPYHIEKYDEEPSQFAYSIAKKTAGLLYFRLDARDSDGEEICENVMSFLAAGFPIAFGFSVPSSLAKDGAIQYRPELDSVLGGQVVVAVGYSKDHFGRGQHALLIRSSWGTQWGFDGNGWLPVAFLRNHLARDFWTLINKSWLTSGELTCPSILNLDRDSGS